MSNNLLISITHTRLSTTIGVVFTLCIWSPSFGFLLQMFLVLYLLSAMPLPLNSFRSFSPVVRITDAKLESLPNSLTIFDLLSFWFITHLCPKNHFRNIPFISPLFKKCPWIFIAHRIESKPLSITSPPLAHSSPPPPSSYKFSKDWEHY